MNQEKKQEKLNKRTLKGRVISDKMDKTVVVQVGGQKTHSKYGKNYQTSANYKAHDFKNAFHVNDEVIIEEMRPLSKDKRWKVVKKIS